MRCLFERLRRKETRSSEKIGIGLRCLNRFHPASWNKKIGRIFSESAISVDLVFKSHKPQPCFVNLECPFQTLKQSEAYDDYPNYKTGLHWSTPLRWHRRRQELLEGQHSDRIDVRKLAAGGMNLQPFMKRKCRSTLFDRHFWSSGGR